MIKGMKLRDFREPNIERDIRIDENTNARQILESGNYNTDDFTLEGILPNGTTQVLDLDRPVSPLVQNFSELRVIPSNLSVAL